MMFFLFFKILSDPQERAWYDSHRDQILAGKDDFVEECINVFQYFSSTCYSGFDDGPQSFYSVYAKLFKDLAAEELGSNFRPNRDETEEQFCSSFPFFGDSKSDYEDVVRPFYAQWEAFRTRKNFTWVEKYDTRQADCRFEKRAMETENKRMREASKRERSDQVRQLVKFVKMRDKRVQAERRRLAALAAENDRKAASLAKEKRLREAERLRESWKHEMTGLHAQWNDELEQHLQRLEEDFDLIDLDLEELVDELDSPDEDVKEGCAAAASANCAVDPCPASVEQGEEESFRCVPCKKDFTSAGLLKSHCGSRAHKKKQDEYNKECNITETPKPTQKTANGEKEPRAMPEAASGPVSSSCLVCSENFPSRTAMFEHIKKTGHAAPKVQVVQKQKQMAKSKGKKK
ncbi:DnaJ subfamily C member 21 [Cichlidogyrus casuarinus]|uniref:DnaJ subfamily C member 21 n=1 Tax=Cichlidogyrus casuarinus TaxID=1844966 RepID=A0ABD2PVS2_9PLAT